MPMSKFCQMAGVTQATVARLKRGYPARRGTVNMLLDTFSQVYGLEFSLENVTGLSLQEHPHQKVLEPSVETSESDSTTTKKKAS
jgi:hypothetical protein